MLTVVRKNLSLSGSFNTAVFRKFSLWPVLTGALLISVFFQYPVNAQQAPTNFVFSTPAPAQLNQDDVPGFGTTNYPSGRIYDLRFGQDNSSTPGQNLIIESFDFNSATYNLITPPTVASPYQNVIVNRVNNTINGINFDKVTAFFSRIQALSTTGSVANNTALFFRPEYVNTMEGLINSFIANRGSDNLFANVNGQTLNNIERVDLILTETGVSTTSPGSTGFLLMERNGNDDFSVAAITGLNPDGTIESLGTLTEAISNNGTGGVWGNTSRSILTTVFQSVASGTPPLLRPSQNLVSQNIHGTYVSFTDLGISAGQVIYGLVLFPGDVTTSMDLIGLSDVPANTSGTNLSTGGLDFMAGGGFTAANPSDVTFNDISLKAGSCWRTLSTPINSQTYLNYFTSFRTDAQDFGGLWTQGMTGARTTTGTANVYTMNSDGSDWTSLSSLNATFTPGTGVLVSVFDQDDPNDINSSGFPKYAAFSGTENSGSIDIDFGAVNGTTGSNGGTQTEDGGFSLLGNPYNSAIDFDLLTTNGINGNVWVYDRNAGAGVNGSGAGGWISANDSGIGDLEDGIIAAGQGFVVQNSNPTTNPGVTFQESAQVANAGRFYGKEKEKPDHFRLEVRGDGVYSSAWVQLSDEGNPEEIIGGDVVQFYPFESEYAVLSTVKKGQMIDIGHFPYPDKGESIPIALESTSSGVMTLSLTRMKYSGINPVYLYDIVTGESIELTEGAEYTFTPEGAPAKAITDCYSAPIGFTGPDAKGKSTAPRFLITSDASIYAPEPDLPAEFTLKQNYPNPFNPTTQITYQLPGKTNVRLEVFDMSGRQVATLVNESVSAGTHTVNFNASNLSSGVYIYKLQTGSAVLTRKLTLIK